MEISVTDFSAPIGASVFKFSVHLQLPFNSLGPRQCRLSSAFIAELLVSLIQQAWIFQSDRIPTNSEAAVKEL